MATARIVKTLKAPGLTLGCLFFFCLVFGCHSLSQVSSSAKINPSPPPGWIEAPPQNCRVGSSGPTMTPGHAVRIARRRGMGQLAASIESVKIRNSSLDISDGARTTFREVTTQTMTSSIKDVRAVSMFRNVSTDTIYVLSCIGTASQPAAPKTKDVPGWVGWNASKSCAIGQSYSAQSLQEQRNLAKRDGVNVLAINLGAHIDSIILDDTQGRDGIMDSVKITPLQSSLEKTQAVSVKWWHDKHGLGPLQFSGVLYARVCISR